MQSERGFQSLSRQRPYTSSYTASIVSLRSLHSETVNIWTHLLGTIWFCARIFRFASEFTDQRSEAASAVMLYLVASTYCFANSALYHLFASHLHASLWLFMDHVGIVCAIWASSVSFSLISFDCQQGERWTYMAFATTATMLSLARLFNTHFRAWQSQRVHLSTHIALGGIAALPGLRCWYLHMQGPCAGPLREFWIMVTMSSIGGGIYATHLLDKAIGTELGIPDASHNTMHLMTVIGALIYERGLVSIYKARVHAFADACA